MLYNILSINFFFFFGVILEYKNLKFKHLIKNTHLIKKILIEIVVSQKDIIYFFYVIYKSFEMEILRW